jgi:1-aminocyclopropane-1-carboxylate deaminase/D-cysteine desulfhydrase-like pyridoxal-dependent ACC family enzyme
MCVGLMMVRGARMTTWSPLRARGERSAVLPFGGSKALVARGYLVCAAELEEQAPDAEHVVVAVGSGATMAGLVAGLGEECVLGVDSGAVRDAPARVAAMVEELTSVRPGERTVFVHSGGLPGLFGHALASELAARTGRCS